MQVCVAFLDNKHNAECAVIKLKTIIKRCSEYVIKNYHIKTNYLDNFNMCYPAPQKKRKGLVMKVIYLRRHVLFWRRQFLTVYLCSRFQPLKQIGNALTFLTHKEVKIQISFHDTRFLLNILFSIWSHKLSPREIWWTITLDNK